MKRKILLLILATISIYGIHKIRSVSADTSTDYTALTTGVTTASVASSNALGTIAVHGRNSFPVLMEPASPYRVTMAAGYYGDNVSGGRGVIYSHTAWTGTSGGVGSLYANALRWAGKKAAPVIGLGWSLHGAAATFTAQGFTVKLITREMLDSSSDLSEIDVFAMHMHQAYTNDAYAKIHAFTANGGGFVLFATPWAMSTGQVIPYQAGFNWANNMLLNYGMTYGTDTFSTTTYSISATPFSSYFSGLNAGDALLKDFNGEITLSVEDKRIAALTIEKVIGARPTLTALNDQVETISNAYGLIDITNTNRLVKANKPVEAMLTRYQSNKFSTMPASQLTAHPSASDWPGLPDAGEAVTKTVTINGNTPTPTLMAYGTRGVRYATGLYARPGTAVNVTIPANMIDKGLSVQIGAHEDENWNLTTWRRHPKVIRKDALTAESIQTGNAWGGLISIWVPASQSLGNFPVTISGAIEAPHFIYGVTTTEEWNNKIKNNPGAWGVMESNRITIYVNSKYLKTISDPNKIIGHWDKCVETADEFLGYSGRKRGEAAITDRDITVGGGHAGYPFIMAYGDVDYIVNRTVTTGDWGFYHELGHSYQADFGSAYTIATHAEVDVNLVPGLLWSKLHDKTTWDVPTLNFYGANHRLSRRANFFALPEEQQTWAEAGNLNASRHVGYDFYYNLAEAFGWDMYKRAHGRLFKFLQNPDNDPALKALDSTDPNYKRNRIFLLYSQESGKNLAAYFLRYGLGKVNYGLTQSVKDLVASLPEWTDNRPLESLSNPGTLAVPANTQPGSELYTFTAKDPEPGTVFTYEITAGNETGAFTIDTRTGILRAATIDMTRPDPYTLTVKVSDNGVPRYSLESTFTITIAPPSVTGAIINSISTINGNIQGSIQVLTPSAITLNGNTSISGDLFVPGTPNVLLNGTPTFGGTVDGAGSAEPNNYTVTLNGNASLQKLVRRTNPIAWPAAVTTEGAQDLIVNGNETKTLPAGIYGNVIINGGGKLIITGGALILKGGLTLNGHATFQGHIIAPSGTVTVNGHTVLTGSVIANGLIINGGGTLSLSF